MVCGSGNENGKISTLMMSTVEALAWIMTRDADFSSKLSREGVLELTFELVEYGLLNVYERQLHALTSLANECRKSRITADGLKGDFAASPAERREVMRPPDWVGLDLTHDGQGAFIARSSTAENCINPSSDCWRDLRFDRHEVLTSFPAHEEPSGILSALPGNWGPPQNTTDTSPDHDPDAFKHQMERLTQAALDARNLLSVAADRPEKEWLRSRLAKKFFGAVEELLNGYSSRQNWQAVQGHPIVALPQEIAMILAGLSGYLAVGMIPQPIADCAQGKRGRSPPGPSERRAIRFAVAYYRAAKNGDIADSSPVKTIMEAYDIARQTVYDWRDKCGKFDPASVCNGELALLPQLMERAGRQYRTAGRSSSAVWRRDTRRM